MSHSLNSLQGDIWGVILWGTIGAIKGDTRSLDSSSYELKLEPRHDQHDYVDAVKDRTRQSEMWIWSKYLWWGFVQGQHDTHFKR